jgi:zinc protease
MRRLLLAASSVAALALAAPALAQPAASPAAGPAPITAPPMDIHTRVLPNGLTLYTVRDTTTPNVTVQIWYGVGAKNDPPGRSGFAHLFEHLMFKGARDMPPEYMDRLTEDVGGFNNASTGDDTTEYHEVIPANHLQRLLWAEAERLCCLVVDEANFESERKVVEEELRQRVLADPYGRLFSLDMAEASWTVHPYHRPPIGSIADLDSATLGDVRAFHSTYYRPDNAHLIVVGNFDPKQLDAWVDQYFGQIARPSQPIPRVTAVEPPRTEAKTIKVYGPNVPLPAVVITFAGPDGASPDAAALKVLDAVMTTGKSSRLYAELVYKRQIATQIFSSPDLRQQPGVIMTGAVMAAGKSAAEGETALRAELARLRDAPVSAAELASAKNQLISQVLHGRETIDGRASEIGSAIITEGGPAKVNSDVAEIAAITAADVQRVARKYLVDDRRISLLYGPDSTRPAGQPDALVQDTPQVQATALPAIAPVQTTEIRAEAEREKPPTPTAAVAAVLPRPAERTLKNGLRVIVAKTSDLPLVTAELSVRNGAALDPDGEAGLSSLTTDLLSQGTTTRSATQIAGEIESLGGSLGSGAGYDSSAITLSSLSTTLPQALPVLADVVRHPAFAQDEIDRLRQQKLDDLTVTLQQPGSLASLASSRLVFGQGPYGHPSGGTPGSLTRITRADVTAQYARLFRPDQAVLVLTGDIEPEAGFALAEKTFGDWAGPAGPAPQAAPTGPAPARRVLVVDLPGAGQAAVLVAGRSISRRDPDFHAVEVANGVLGGGYSARLNEEVRIKRGLSYGSGSAVVARRSSGLFEASAQTKNESADEVAGLLLSEVARLGAEAAPPVELAARKSTLTGEFGREAATGEGLGRMLSQDVVEDVDPADVDRYIAGTEAVTGEAEKTAAAHMVDPATADIVVVGDAKFFLPALKERFGTVSVVEADKLDLDAADLGAKPQG